MASLVDHYRDFASMILRPSAFSQQRLAKDSFSGLKLATTYSVTAVGLALLALGLSGNLEKFKILVPLALAVVPTSACIFFAQRKRGIDFLQSTAISVLVYGMTYTILAIVLYLETHYWLEYIACYSNVIFMVTMATILFGSEFYIVGYAAPKMLSAITKASHGQALGVLVSAFLAGCIIASVVTSALPVSIRFSFTRVVYYNCGYQASDFHH